MHEKPLQGSCSWYTTSAAVATTSSSSSSYTLSKVIVYIFNYIIFHARVCGRKGVTSSSCAVIVVFNESNFHAKGCHRVCPIYETWFYHLQREHEFLNSLQDKNRNCIIIIILPCTIIIIKKKFNTTGWFNTLHGFTAWIPYYHRYTL